MARKQKMSASENDVTYSSKWVHYNRKAKAWIKRQLNKKWRREQNKETRDWE